MQNDTSMLQLIHADPIISVIRTMEAVYGCLAVSQVHVDGEEMEVERFSLLCGHLRGDGGNRNGLIRFT